MVTAISKPGVFTIIFVHETAFANIRLCRRRSTESMHKTEAAVWAGSAQQQERKLSLNGACQHIN
jgi:hypothetical protein